MDALDVKGNGYVLPTPEPYSVPSQLTSRCKILIPRSKYRKLFRKPKSRLPKYADKVSNSRGFLACRCLSYPGFPQRYVVPRHEDSRQWQSSLPTYCTSYIVATRTLRD